MNNTSMNFKSFTQAILEKLQEMLGDNYSVFSQKVKKNNGIELTGVIAKRKERNAAPTIYINEFYHEGMTEEEMNKIGDLLYHDFQAAEFEDNVDLSGFTEFEKAKKQLVFKLVHAQRNEELLKLIPHKLFHNLAVVFYYTVQEPPFYGKAAILVYNSHMQQWGTNLEQLYQAAMENAPVLFPSTIDSMQKVMVGILEEELKEDILSDENRKDDGLFEENWVEELAGQMIEDMKEMKMPMYVLTNQQKLYGAACMLYPGVLKAFGEKTGQDFYVLPSSVHEVILVPATPGTDERTLWAIVTEINRTQVAEDEILADSIYYYSRNMDKILRIS
ncbi:DUF5688 family protein [Parablautia muri]|uniref:Uncharacterized protein n=1 Tax=Parablautia muri TaxID=2320879 RepID=A0A9X5GT36_9FIRM|nr:DUF5688 family protein [Parablautia muri]NBJ93415.1 hypothetical protein [Parablautia muri]